MPVMIQLESSTEPVFQALVLRRHFIRQYSMTLVYQVKRLFSLPLDPLATLSSRHFTPGKIASEYDAIFEWYRILRSY